MKNDEIADIFERMADLMDLLGESTFRVGSYHKAARAVSELSEPIEDIAAAGKLQDIPGVGKSTAEKIEQFLDTGHVEQYEQLRGKVPPHLTELLEVSGLGPRTAGRLWKEAGITSPDELRSVVENDPARLTALDGFGDKKVQQLAESLATATAALARRRLGEAIEPAETLRAAVAACKGAGRVEIAGSLRRAKETVGDLDLLCEGSAEDAGAIIAAFTTAANVHRVLASGETKGSVVLTDGMQADLRVVAKESFGAALAYFTGPKEHNIRLRAMAIKKGWKLNEYGLFDGERMVAGADEADIYKALGLQFVAPELREDRGEVEAAAKHALPKLLELSDIRGDLHMHTRASDGHNSIQEMIDACRDRGYKYLCISDHSKGQVQAHGLDKKRLAKHVEAIHRAGADNPDMLVLAGCEVDILKDGKLDFEADVLAKLDFVTASPHAALAQHRDEATRRLIRAIKSPHVHCIGHPTGRLINKRAGMEIDIEAIASAAAANDVALEINAHYWRLDLRDVHVKAAIDAGAKIIINTDAHSIADLELMHYGVSTARRGWATAGDVLNTFTPAKLNKWIKAKK